MPRASAIYEGKVWHRRFLPRHHDLRYRVWYALLDLDELDELDRDIPFFGNERKALLSFRRRDHGPRDGSALRPWLEGHLASAGVDLEGGPIRLLAFPRMLGYAFNPISVWFAHGPLGDLRALLFEVSNTFGQWHHYLVAVQPGEGLRTDGRQVVRVTFDKELFVSPFITMDASYDITTRTPDERMSLAIKLTTDEGHLLTATFDGKRAPMDAPHLWWAFMRHPLLTFKVVAGIHWEAIKLWRKGAPYRKRGAPPAADLTVVRTAEEAALA